MTSRARAPRFGPIRRHRFRHDTLVVLAEDQEGAPAAKVMDLAREEFADRRQTGDRFDRVLEEMRRDREDQARRWGEQNRKWDEFQYIFERRARFYEKRYGRQASRLLVISPMVDARARTVAERLGIEVYSDAVDVATI